MPIAIVLRLDAETCGYIDAMAEALPDRCHRNPSEIYPPHLRLAVYSDAVDPGDIDKALATLVGAWNVLPATLAGIGVFPGDPPTLWLAVVPTIELLTRHANLHRAMTDLPTHPTYEVGGWVPHVTLGRTHFVADTIKALAATWDGLIVGRLASLDLIRTDPLVVLSRRLLRG